MCLFSFLRFFDVIIDVVKRLLCCSSKIQKYVTCDCRRRKIFINFNALFGMWHGEKKILIDYFRLDLVNSWNGHKTLARIISWDFLTADCRFSGFLLKDNIMLNFCFTGSNNQFRNYENWSFVLRKVCWKSFFKLKTVWPDTNKQQIFINNFRIHSFRIGYWILWATWSYVIVRRPRNLKKISHLILTLLINFLQIFMAFSQYLIFKNM